MIRYAAFLRGINVGGKNKITMESLKELFSDAGFDSPRTYLNSGNVIFESDNHDQAGMEKLIKNEIISRLKLEIEVIIRNQNELAEILAANPFESLENNYTVLLKVPAAFDVTAEIEKVKNIEDQYLILKNVIYIYVPGGFGRSKLTNAFFEKHLKSAATTRNIKTMMKMVSLTGEN